MRWIGWWSRLALVLAAMLVAAPVPAQAGQDDIEILSEQQLSPRLTELTLRTAALAQPTTVRVLLPAGYAAESARRYPVLYLLHGCCDYDVDGSQAWTTHGRAEELTASLPLIVVMPAAGRGGFYTDWYNNGLGGTPAWESYHIGQLIPFVDGRYRTVANRRGRAVAGLSMGGFGTMSYAARHPDLFSFAASFSGALNSREDGMFSALDLLTLQDGGPPGSVWGQYATEEVRWRAHNPTDLAANLRPLTLQVRTGNGEPGGAYGGGPDPVERAVHAQSTSFHERLTELGIPHVWDDYGPGAHAWEYWAHDLELTLPALMDTFAQAPEDPATVTYSAIEPRYDVFGWQVDLIDRRVLEFSTLRDAGPKGFSLEGSGTATVTTAPLFKPGRRYRAAQETGTGTTTRDLTVDGRGRLRVTVALGPANSGQQYRPGTATTVHRAKLTLTRLADPCLRHRKVKRRTRGGKRRTVRVCVARPR